MKEDDEKEEKDGTKETPLIVPVFRGLFSYVECDMCVVCCKDFFFFFLKEPKAQTF